MATSIASLGVQEDVLVTIAGTVVGVREDEFLLQDTTGQILVDAVRGGPGTIDLAVGEQVTVIGDLDDLEDFDALQIFRVDGSEVIGQPLLTPRGPGNGRGRGPGNGRGRGRGEQFEPDPLTGMGPAPLVNIADLEVQEDVLVAIAGTVVGVREDEFLLQDTTGRILVDAVRGGPGTIDLAVGQQVIVVGDLDDLEDFDALTITVANLMTLETPIPTNLLG